MRFFLLCALLGVLPSALAHDLQFTLDNRQASVIRLFYSNELPFAYEQYELYPPGQSIPAQVGRTDAQGRLVFLTDTAGQWRLKVFAEDGHGLDTMLTISASGEMDAQKPLIERHTRLLVGVSLIFGLFGLISLFYRRK
jgi:nickel transport protein